VIRSLETLHNIRTTGRYIPEDANFHNYGCENLKSYIDCAQKTVLRKISESKREELTLGLFIRLQKSDLIEERVEGICISHRVTGETISNSCSR
jgi:hypothetical protein